MSYLPCKKCFTYNMDINKCNQQKCNLNNFGLKVDDISAVEKKQICLNLFYERTVFFQCSKRFNQNQGAKAIAQ